MVNQADYLVVGMDGNLGKMIFNRLNSAGHNVYGTSRRKSSVKIGALHLDLATDSDQWQLPNKVGIAFITAGMTKLEECRDNPDLSHKINVSSIQTLVKRLLDRNAYVIVLSSGHVFDGKTENRKPDDQTSPIDEYGRQKAEMEKQLDNYLDDISILRSSRMLSRNFSRFQNWEDTWIRNEVVTPFSDFFLCPVPYESVVSLLFLMGMSKAKGIYHFSAERDISYAEAAKIGCATLGFDSNLVKPKTAKELGYNGPLFKKTSLDIIKTLELLGINAPKAEWTIARAFK